jgi:hypothetical protein
MGRHHRHDDDQPQAHEADPVELLGALLAYLNKASAVQLVRVAGLFAEKAINAQGRSTRLLLHGHSGPGCLPRQR